MQTAGAAPEATPENLAHFAANPDALANMTDEELDKLANAPAPEQTAAEDKGDTTGSASPAAAGQTTEAEPQTKPTETTAAPAAEEGDKVVQGRDGKSIIPYSVLERERERAGRAEATAEALAEEIERLKSGGKPADTTQVQLSEDDLAQLEQDLPGVAKAIKAQLAMIEHLTGTVQTLKRGQENVERSAEQVRKDEEEAAIAASETLTALLASVEAKDQKAAARWNRIVDTYESMRGDPAFEALDTAALIGKAEASVAALYGPMEVAAKTAAASPKQEDTTAALDAKAKAALEAAAKPAVPLSSGALPGGSAPPVDEAAAMLEKSGAQLTAEFMNMTPEQIEARLARMK